MLYDAVSAWQSVAPTLWVVTGIAWMLAGIWLKAFADGSYRATQWGSFLWIGALILAAAQSTDSWDSWLIVLLIEVSAWVAAVTGLVILFGQVRYNVVVQFKEDMDDAKDDAEDGPNKL